MRRTTGRYEKTVAGGAPVSAFVPAPLPPADPPLEISARTAEILRAAERAVMRLDTACGAVPSLDWFIYGFVRKEAVITSQIEGTQATLIDLLSFEAAGAARDARPDGDVEDVCNYLDALNYARAELAKPKGLPVSVRLLNGAHKRLMRGAAGAGKQPGEIRRSQNWIGGRPERAVHVPPPPNLLPGLMRDLENYLHAGADAGADADAADALPPLIRIGLAHAQFETIHPYLDGNGRIGRLLIALLLEDWGILRAPLLYISLFFRRRQQEYYARLNAARKDGDWEGWIEFFLEGVAETADEAADAAGAAAAVVEAGRARALAHAGASVTAMRLFEALPDHPVITAAGAVKLTGASKPAAISAVQTLTAADILHEITGKKRGREYAWRDYISVLRTGEG